MITLATLSKATAQEVFDQIKNHLLTQNEKSQKESGICMYRFEELSCAAGCLISNEEYSERMERSTWPQLIVRKIVPPHHAELIKALQEVHDNSAPEVWRPMLMETAKEFNLQFNEKI